MAIPVTQEHVEKSGAEELLRVHEVARLLLDDVVQVVGADDIERPREREGRIVVVIRPLLDESEHSGVLRAKLPEARVIGKHDHFRVAVEHARRFGKGRRHRGAGRMCCTDLVLGDAGRQRPLEIGWEQLGCILVDRAEGILLPVGSGEAQGLGLQATALLDRREAAGKGAEVEHFHPDRGDPERPVVLAEEPLVQAAGLVARARHYGGTFGGRGGMIGFLPAGRLRSQELAQHCQDGGQ